MLLHVQLQTLMLWWKDQLYKEWVKLVSHVRVLVWKQQKKPFGNCCTLSVHTRIVIRLHRNTLLSLGWCNNHINHICSQEICAHNILIHHWRSSLWVVNIKLHILTVTFLSQSVQRNLNGSYNIPPVVTECVQQWPIFLLSTQIIYQHNRLESYVAGQIRTQIK